jgi:phosphoenolpyruvate carboxykinase (GTP)
LIGLDKYSSLLSLHIQSFTHHSFHIETLTDHSHQKWTPSCGRKAAHSNARYTTHASQLPVIDADWENPNGVPISAFIFGGKRFSVFPLVLEAFNWEHGIFLGSLVSQDNVNEQGKQIVVRESFAMMPYCSYDMCDYFEKLLQTGITLGFNAPKVFYVNWFRKDEKGNFLWPGFGENSRVLKWIFQRIESTSDVVKTPLGYVPAINSLDLKGLDISKETMTQLLKFEPSEWSKECKEIEEFYNKFGPRLPEVLKNELKKIQEHTK